MSCAEIEKEFNELFVTFINDISRICPNSLISNNINIINKFITNEPTKVLDLFTKHVLKYKNYIDKGDENFFLNHNYSDDFNDKNNFMKVFEFKNIWKTLNTENKENIILYMQYLCGLSLKYFNKKYMIKDL
jgi:hypothetical protein